MKLRNNMTTLHHTIFSSQKWVNEEVPQIVKFHSEMWNRNIFSRFRVRFRIQARGTGFGLGFGTGFAVSDFAVHGSGPQFRISRFGVRLP